MSLISLHSGSGKVGNFTLIRSPNKGGKSTYTLAKRPAKRAAARKINLSTPSAAAPFEKSIVDARAAKRYKQSCTKLLGSIKKKAGQQWGKEDSKVMIQIVLTRMIINGDSEADAKKYCCDATGYDIQVWRPGRALDTIFQKSLQANEMIEVEEFNSERRTVRESSLRNKVPVRLYPKIHEQVAVWKSLCIRLRAHILQRWLQEKQVHKRGVEE